MNAGWSRALAASLGALALFALYGYASWVVPAGANVMPHSSGIYDMDVGRVVADFTTGLPAYRPVVHPLQKLLVAPLGHFVNTRLFEGRDRLGAAKVLIAASMTLDAWLAIGFLGVGCSFLAVLLYFVALRRTESQKVGVYLYTIPPMTAVVAVLYLGETLSVNLVLGAVLVIAGVALTERG